MTGFAGSSYAAFALVWGFFCVVSAALVTDTMLRGARPASRRPDQEVTPAAAGADDSPTRS